MHPALRISNLNRLPSFIQTAARAAAGGSLTNLLKIENLMKNLRAEETVLLLPVFYVNLDVSGIPSVADLELDPPSSTVRTAVKKAVCALRSLEIIRGIPEDACADLWARVWPWTQFLHTFREILAVYIHYPLREAKISTGLLQFVGSLQTDKRAAALFSGTPGFRFIIGRAWFFVLGLDVPEASVGYHHLSGFFEECMDACEPDNVAELVDAAGGSFDALASFVVRHLNQLIPRHDTVVSDFTEYFIRGVLIMVADTERVPLTNPNAVMAIRSQIGPLVTALISHGVVKCLSTAACALIKSTAAGKYFSLAKLLIIFGRILTSQNAYRILPDALDAGLLAFIIMAGKSSLKDSMYDHIVYLISRVIQVSLVHYNVLLTLDKVLPQIAAMEEDEIFKKSKMFEHWVVMRNLSNERLRLLRSFNAERSPLYKACDNLQCGRIGDRPEFKRCGGCRCSYYCSNECQIQDWRHDNHRFNCSPYRPFCLNEQTSHTVRERAFLRTLLHHDYSKSSDVNVHLLEVAFMNSNPNVPFLTLFDYTSGPVEITTCALIDAADLATSPLWPDDVARAATSGDRMRLHVMRVAEERGHRHWIIPLRRDTGKLADGLRRIAAELPQDQARWEMPIVLQMIRAELDNGGQPAIEIH
ncbi:hypothetical protein B0H11DRAFT_1934828 [Mycena galericulata]|nr:hypothetical protein B0H11DRAFT_1934828 [Mycena galericulata]